MNLLENFLLCFEGKVNDARSIKLAYKLGRKFEYLKTNKNTINNPSPNDLRTSTPSG